MSDYFSIMFIPVLYTNQNNIATYYTSSLTLILKIIKLDFMFPYERNMYNIDILFNDKNSADCFDNWISIEDIISSVVSNRLNEKMELDLSNLCNDPGMFVCFCVLPVILELPAYLTQLSSKILLLFISLFFM